MGWALQKALSYCLTGVGTIIAELCPFTEEEIQLRVTWAMLSHSKWRNRGLLVPSLTVSSSLSTSCNLWLCLCLLLYSEQTRAQGHITLILTASGTPAKGLALGQFLQGCSYWGMSTHMCAGTQASQWVDIYELVSAAYLFPRRTVT